jgi:hypothetical protein
MVVVNHLSGGVFFMKGCRIVSNRPRLEETHTLKLFSRPIVALILTVIYSLIIMSPLAPLALQSPRVAHAVTGECSGNCDICGCSAERRASHTCCCFLKKKLQHDHKNVPDCCKKKKRSKMTMLSCNCPCGGNKMPGLAGSEKTEVMPYRFNDGIVSLAENPLFSSTGKCLTDRHGDPPDPPPKLHLIS